MEPLFKAKYEQLLDNLTEKAKTGKPIDFKEYVLIKLALITFLFFTALHLIYSFISIMPRICFHLLSTLQQR